MTELKVHRFSEISRYYANIICYARILLLFLACFIFPHYPKTAGFVVLFSQALDYIDGKVARAYNQCSFFGHIVDWVGDVFSQIVIFMFWTSLDYTYTPFFIIFLTIEVMVMIVESITHFAHKEPMVDLQTTRHPFFWVLQWTFIMGRKGYSSNDRLGYIIQMNYLFWAMFCYFSLLSPEILFFRLMAYSNFVPALMYVWMHGAYLTLCLQSWEQTKHEQPVGLKKEVEYEEARTKVL